MRDVSGLVRFSQAKKRACEDEVWCGWVVVDLWDY
jgi:hypothetical protein